MLGERIKELVDFATSESPYRSANKGWINDDVYLQWGSSSVQATNAEGGELADVSIFWKPINELLLILFAVVFLATTFVFTGVSISHGKLNLSAVSSRSISSPLISSVASLELDADQLAIANVPGLDVAEEPVLIASSEPSFSDLPEIGIGTNSLRDSAGGAVQGLKKVKLQTAVDLFQPNRH